MIKDRIREDMKAAMRSHEAARLSTIRLLLAAIKQREVDERIDADDAVVMQVISKMVKQRRDSVQQYRDGGREDLAFKKSAASSTKPSPNRARAAWPRWAKSWPS